MSLWWAPNGPCHHCAPPCHPERSKGRVEGRGMPFGWPRFFAADMAQNDIFRGYGSLFTGITVGPGSRLHRNDGWVPVFTGITITLRPRPTRRPRCPISVIHGPTTRHPRPRSAPTGMSPVTGGDGLLDAHDAVAGVDGDDGARYSGGKPAAQEQGGVRYLLVRHVALHRRPVGVGAAHIVETGY